MEAVVLAQIAANGPDAPAHIEECTMSTRKKTLQAEADDIVDSVGVKLVLALFRDGKSLEEVAKAQRLHPVALAMFGMQFAGRIFERLQPTYALGDDPEYVEAEMGRMRAQIIAMDALLPPELRGV
ncbi:hypothetical protein ASF53_14195 [Methylobacterium sp. Leaf123]|uniref:hypothetical protein n=1 Tax=Methylobacterium sp. Leaf123 TaxID=1736264 RepID=UPI0006FB8B97|nr:hypothetical protein [Methylobacterium sp. Leaf123]KQQ13314.1 hypothetical protein ASF53_14195 [Methylobacterium sp. Leaf123]